MKNIIETDIFFNEEQGFIIMSYTKIKESGLRVGAEPSIKLPPNATTSELTRNILASLKASENAEPVKGSKFSYSLVQVAGIRSYTKVSKTHRLISVTKTEEGYALEEFIKKRDRSYVPGLEESIVYLPLTVAEDELGNAVLALLAKDVAEDNNTGQIETLNENTIAFTYPSDDYIATEDVHEGYYTFIYDTGDDAKRAHFSFAFCHHVGINKNIVKAQWERLHGQLQEYEFKENKTGMFKYTASGKSKYKMLVSNFIKDDDLWCELVLEINCNELTPEEICSIQKAYETLKASCAFIKK